MIGEPAPMAHTSVLLVVSAGRVPTITATAGRPGEVQVVMEVAGGGYGISVVMVGPREILGVVVADLGAALDGVTGKEPE